MALPSADPPQPTQLDFDNAATRAAIAERQLLEYAQVLRWAMGAFGPGWVPSNRHFLIEKCEEERVRYTGERPVVSATVYTVKNATGDRRHFTVVDGQVAEHESMEAGFGDMLLEPDRTRTIAVRGQQVHPHRYSLCFAPYELYRPKTADQLAALRQSRERRAAERAEQEWQEENPLLAWLAREHRTDEEEERGR